MLTEASSISIGLVFVLAAAVTTFYFRLVNQIDEAVKQERIWREEQCTGLKKELDRVSSELQTRDSLRFREFSAYQLEASKTFVTREHTQEMETRIMAVLSQISSRVETLINRNERLMLQLARNNLPPDNTPDEYRG